MNEFGIISLIIGIAFLILAILVKPDKQVKY
jgi:energy-converting hydrogenase Eha subunit H